MRRISFTTIIWFVVLVILLAVASTAFADDALVNLTPRQKDQLKTLASDTRDKTKRERDNLKQSRKDLWQAYSNFNLDEHKVKTAQSKIAAAQLSLLNLHLENEIALRNILTEAQFQTFRKNMAKRMRGHERLMPQPQDAAIEKIMNKDVLNSIGLNKVQTRRIIRQIKPTPEKLRIFESLRQSSRQLLDLYSTYTFDPEAARKLIGTIHSNQITLARFQNNRQQFLRNVLTQDQFEKLRQEIKKKVDELKAQRNEKG